MALLQDGILPKPVRWFIKEPKWWQENLSYAMSNVSLYICQFTKNLLWMHINVSRSKLTSLASSSSLQRSLRLEWGATSGWMQVWSLLDKMVMGTLEYMVRFSSWVIWVICLCVRVPKKILGTFLLPSLSFVPFLVEPHGQRKQGSGGWRKRQKLLYYKLLGFNTSSSRICPAVVLTHFVWELFTSNHLRYSYSYSNTHNTQNTWFCGNFNSSQ